MILRFDVSIAQWQQSEKAITRVSRKWHVMSSCERGHSHKSQHEWQSVTFDLDTSQGLWKHFTTDYQEWVGIGYPTQPRMKRPIDMMGRPTVLMANHVLAASKDHTTLAGLGMHVSCQCLEISGERSPRTKTWVSWLVLQSYSIAGSSLQKKKHKTNFGIDSGVNGPIEPKYITNCALAQVVYK